MKPILAPTVALLGPLALLSCSEPTTYPAEVKLAIGEQSFDYTTSKAQLDQQVTGGRYSVYLLPEDDTQRAPYVCYRTYMGNPVSYLWVRYTKPNDATAEDDEELRRYECYVPGTLSDGTPTLGWRHENGKERDLTETGQDQCNATLKRDGNQLKLSFDALLSPHVKKKKGRKELTKEQKAELRRKEGIVVKGTATLTLPSG